MKKTILSLLVVCGCAAAAHAEQTTLDLFASTEHWQLTNKQYPGATPAIDTVNKVLTASAPGQAGWGRGCAIYTFATPISLTNATDTLTFSFDLTQTDADVLSSVALVGDSQTIVMGSHYNWESLQYGLISKGTDDGADMTYSAGASTWTNYYAANADYGQRYDLIAVDTSNPVTISGEIAYANDQYVLTLTTGSVTKTLNLGDSVQVNQISIALDGPSNKFPAVSKLTITAPVPEPATATLSLLALAGLAARRRRH